MGAYDAASALALRLIGQKGALTTFTREGASVDYLTQEAAAPSTFTANAVAFPLSTKSASVMFGAANVGKAQLDVHIALQGTGYAPQGGDLFSWGGQNYRLLDNPEMLNPDGAGAFYAHCYAEVA